MAENDEYTSLSELENDKSKWNLASDLKLLNTFKFTTEEILKKIQNNSSVFDDLSYKTSVCTDKINNLITDVLILTNSKFIENRVYEEDIKEIAPSSKPSPFKKGDQSNSEQVVVEKLKNSIISGINCLSQRYDISPGDIESPFNRNNLLSTLYVHKNRFVSKPLPYLIGSDDFTKDTFVGLKLDSDGPVIVLNRSNDYESKNVDDADSMASDASSGSFHFGANQVNKPIGKSNGVVPSTEEQSRKPLFNAPIRNTHIFGSDFDDDDIFTEKVVPTRSTNTNHRADNVAKDILNQDATSNNSSNASLVKEIKSTNRSFPKPNNDFFDSISNENSDDDDNDLFEKRPVVIASIKPVDFDVKSDVSSSNNDTSSSATTNDVEKKWNEHSPTSTAKKAVKSRLDSIFSSDEDEDVDIFNVSISKTTTANSTKLATKVNAFSSDDDDDDLFSQLKKNDSKPTLISTGTSKVVTLSTEASKVPVEPSKFMPNVISELSAALKYKKVARVDDDNSSEGEINTPIEKPVSNVASSGTSPKPKVAQSNNLFNDVAKPKVSTAKQPSKFSAFSSDEDDDDDLFSQLKRPVSKPAASSLVTNKTVTVSTEPQKVQFEVPIPVESTKPVIFTTETPKERDSSVEQKDKPHSPNVPLMPNLISELGAVLKGKNVERGILSNDNDADNRPVVENSSKLTPSLESTLLPTPLRAADPNDSFNDMLKHKAKLNARRSRKRPSLRPRDSLLASNTADAVIADEKVEPISTNTEPVLETQEEPVENKLHASLPSIESPRPNNSTLNSILSSSDESESDLFSAKPSSKNVSTTPTKPPVSSKASKPSFLDTSDDSDGDSDIFSKPAAAMSTATIRSPVVVSKEAKRAPISLFNDSDDGDDDFLSASLAKIPTENATNKQPTQANRSAAKKPVEAKKSIFDNDSDSDDLFK